MPMQKKGNYTAPYYKREVLRFRCTQCGACCTGGPDYQVWLENDEPERIRKFLGISRAWIYRRYMARDGDQESVLRSRDNGECIFLDRDGRCAIYPVRPRQCSTYPFWPEVVITSRGWNKEAKRCEGINRGCPVPVKKIEKILAIQVKKIE
jgi:Fe-S-cluster containining protein